MDGNGRNGNGNGNGSRRCTSNGGGEAGKAVIALVIGTLVYYHCAFRNSTILSLFSDVFIVLLCSLAILGLLFRQMNIQVPVDPLEWQISQESANTIVAWLANTIGATESVLRVAATGHDKRLFVKVIVCLYVLSALGRLALGVTVAYAGPYFLLPSSLCMNMPMLMVVCAGLCLFCLYMLAHCSQSISAALAWLFGTRNDTNGGDHDTIM